MSRERERLALNRLLIRHERLTERDLAKAFRAMGQQIETDREAGFRDIRREIFTETEQEIARILRARLTQIARLYGDRTLTRLERLSPKSYYGRVVRGPVRGRDFVALEHKQAREIFEAAIRSWIELRALDAAVTVMGPARELVRAAIAQGNSEGLGEAGIVKLIRQSVRELTGWRAARIARTETHTAANVGSDEAARSTGLEIVKEWLSAEDARVRSSHASADGQEVARDDAFSVGGARLMFPGDPAGPANETINCRCTTLHHPVIDGEVIR